MLTLLHSLPTETGPITIRLCSLVFEDKPTMQFGTPEETDETANSRSKPLNIGVIELVEVCSFIYYIFIFVTNNIYL